jgi:hypothetical protein
MGLKYAWQSDDFDFETDSILCNFQNVHWFVNHIFLVLFESQRMKTLSAWSLAYAELFGRPVARGLWTVKLYYF